MDETEPPEKNPFNTREEFLQFLAKVDPSKLTAGLKDELSKYLERENIRKSRDEYYAFVLLMGPLLIDGFETGRHIEKIAGELQTVSEKLWEKNGKPPVRLSVSLPPGGMKSMLCTKMYAAWLLGKYPSIRIIIIGHGLQFTKDEFGSKVRDILRMEEYQKIFPGTELRPDKATEGRFLTTKGGEMFCGSLGAKIAGRRSHIVIADDAIVEGDALNKNIRQGLVSDYIPNVRARLLPRPRGAELNIGTRWALGDLFDHLEKSDKSSSSPWRIVKIPALLTEEASTYLRRPGDPEDYLVPGSSFWPEYYSTEYLLNIKASLANDNSRWMALYMQSPTAQDGSILSPSHFRLWGKDETPDFVALYITADTAFTTQTQSDYSSIQLWGEFFYNTTLLDGKEVRMKNYLLLDHVKKKMISDDVEDLIYKWDREYKPDAVIIEKRSSGLVIGPRLINRFVPVQLWKTERDKYSRLQASAPFVKSGLFWVPKPVIKTDDPEQEKTMKRICDMTDEFVYDITTYPDVDHDDVADAFSQFVLWLRESGKISHPDDEEPQSPDLEDEEDFSYNDGQGLYTRGLWG